MVEKWAYFFKYTPEVEEQKIKEVFKDDIIMLKAYEELDRFSWTKEEYELYEKVVKRKMDNAAAEKFVIMEAEKRGIEKEKLEIARKLKATGMSREEIERITELKREEIEKF